VPVVAIPLAPGVGRHFEVQLPGADSDPASTTCVEGAKHATLLEQAKAQARAAAFLGEADKNSHPVRERRFFGMGASES
jgi:hypothetical protein